MTVHILLFGHYKDAAPAGAEGGAFPIEVSERATPAHVARHLAERDARLADLLLRTRVAVNAEFADAATPLSGGDEVAFLPPMSGG
uniref:Molybdopterin synthase sulfur carrier subunit n=1 Tax=uncultured Armatimonadetes bacterium TaxID=157466 RepID=A0A6J4IZH5_9BACT|nr:hypothetical protein AVDCRST_MAG63-2623 [uncultured Armatimonadetes bacterium]